MAIYNTKRSGPHPIAVVEELLLATQGIKDLLIEQKTKLPQGTISKLRKHTIRDPRISSVVRLAKSLGYRLTLAPEMEVAPSPEPDIVSDTTSAKEPR